MIVGSAKPFPSLQPIPELQGIEARWESWGRGDTLDKWGSPRGCPTLSTLCDELRKKENKASKVHGKHISCGSDSTVFGKAPAHVASCAIWGTWSFTATANTVSISRVKVWAWSFQVQKCHLYLCLGKGKKDIKLQWFLFLGRNGRILSQHNFVNPPKALLLMHQQPWGDSGFFGKVTAFCRLCSVKINWME